MKKLLFITLTLMVFLLSSCKKNEDFTNPANLTGTSWKSDNMGTTSAPDYMMLKFISKTTVEVWFKSYGDATFTMDSSGIYTISGNSITIDIGDGHPTTGGIDGNTMTFVENGETIKFTKQ